MGLKRPASASAGPTRPFEVAGEQLRSQVQQGRLPGFMSYVLKEL